MSSYRLIDIRQPISKRRSAKWEKCIQYLCHETGESKPFLGTIVDFRFYDWRIASVLFKLHATALIASKILLRNSQFRDTLIEVGAGSEVSGRVSRAPKRRSAFRHRRNAFCRMDVFSFGGAQRSLEDFRFYYLIFAGAVALVIVLAVAAYKHKRARQDALAAFAGGNGYQFYPDGLSSGYSMFGNRLMEADSEFVARFNSFFPFHLGNFDHIENLVTKQEGESSIYAFDYYYIEKETDAKGTVRRDRHCYGVVAVRLGLLLPHVRLSPENILLRVGKAFGMRELTLESEEFNRKYFVVASDPRAAYDVLHPRAIEYLLRHPARDWQFGEMFIVVIGGSLSAPEISRAVEEIRGFIDLIPGYVREDKGFVPRWQNPLDT